MQCTKKRGTSRRPPPKCDVPSLNEELLAWDSLAMLEVSFGPFGAKAAKRVRHEFPEPPAPEAKKSLGISAPMASWAL